MSALCTHCGFDMERDKPLTVGEAHWSPETGFVYAGQAVHLPSRSKAILLALLKAGGRCVSLDAMINRLDLDESEDPRNLLGQHICKLRKALRPFGADRHVTTQWGKGWKWSA